ncbi:MAG: hypothetical protein IID41_05825 [Planctomycetes bacterium]|nr:hypothetical protein [Planctomycetota bacterium]
MSNRRSLVSKVFAIVAGGCLLQLGGCGLGSLGGLGGLGGLVAAPLLFQAFGGLLGGN